MLTPQKTGTSSSRPSRPPRSPRPRADPCSPGIPGDSGSAFLDGKGLASGTLSTLQFAPVVGANGVGYLPNELAYARSFSDFASLEVALGTEPFAVRVRLSSPLARLTF